MLVMDPWGGNPMGALYPSSGSTQPPRTARRASAAMTGRTGCLNWARPDRWEPWGATPRATRPRQDSRVGVLLSVSGLVSPNVTAVIRKRVADLRKDLRMNCLSNS
jgi:hypothetical protein